VTGIKAVKMIKEFDPDAKVIMISSMGQECFVRDAILAGAKRIHCKTFSKKIMLYRLLKNYNSMEVVI